ncbi:MAG: hypothetical protein LBF74_10805 [Treponema sp.]|jgi:hypothetical protein|nr:hypothetical protein [Treponema sp.]
MKKQFLFTAAGKAIFTLSAGIALAALSVSCASYGIGGGYAAGTKQVEQDYDPDHPVDLSEQRYSVYLSGSNEANETSIAYFTGAFNAEAQGVKASQDLRGLNFTTHVKFPFEVNQFFSPMLLFGWEYPWYYDDTPDSLRKEKYTDTFYLGDLAMSIGLGFDISFSKSLYIRGRAYYAPPLPMLVNKIPGFSFTVGLGYKTDDDKTKGKWKTGDQRAIENINKQGPEALTKKDYARAAALYTQGIRIQADNYNYYYRRSEARAGQGDYAGALDDFNRATRINPLLQGTKEYDAWKRLVAAYEAERQEDAPMDDQGKVIVGANLKLANRGSPTPWKGSGNGVSYPAGAYNFTFWYESGGEKSGEVTFNQRIEAGRVYYAEYTRKDFTVTIRLVDATERELRGGGETAFIASKNAEIFVPELPVDARLPSWVKAGMAWNQIRGHLSGGNLTRDGDLYVYIVSKQNKMIVYGFGLPDGQLSNYEILLTANLNGILNYFKKTIGQDPVSDKDDEGRNTYTWLLPLVIRQDVFRLIVVQNDDSTVYIQYDLFNFDD